MKKLDSFSEGSVICGMESTEKYHAIHELIEKATVFKTVGHADTIESAVIAREALESTGIGHGIAIAHGKCTHMKEVLVALGISQRGVQFDAPDGQPVHFLFLVANNPNAKDEYLHTLTSLTRMMQDPVLRRRLIHYSRPERAEKLLHREITRYMKNLIPRHEKSAVPPGYLASCQ